MLFRNGMQGKWCLLNCFFLQDSLLDVSYEFEQNFEKKEIFLINSLLFTFPWIENVKRQCILTIIKTTYDNVLAKKKTVLEFIHSMEFYYSPANEVHRDIEITLFVRLFVHIRVLPVTFKFCFDTIIAYSNMCDSQWDDVLRTFITSNSWNLSLTLRPNLKV